MENLHLQNSSIVGSLLTMTYNKPGPLSLSFPYKQKAGKAVFSSDHFTILPNIVNDYWQSANIFLNGFFEGMHFTTSRLNRAHQNCDSSGEFSHLNNLKITFYIQC